MNKLLTCPESAHLEMIEYDATPVGTIIRACSRFRPASALTCARICAARLDRHPDAPIEIRARSLCDDDELDLDTAACADR